MPRLLDLPPCEPEFKRIFGPIREELKRLAELKQSQQAKVSSEPQQAEPEPPEPPLFGHIPNT